MTGTSAIFVSVWSGSHSLNAEDKQMHRQQMHPIQRGDIFYADLAPVIGSEQGGIRPVLIIQNNIGDQAQPHNHRRHYHRPAKEPLSAHTRTAG